MSTPFAMRNLFLFAFWKFSAWTSESGNWRRKRMDEIRKNLEAAYGLLSRLQVSGDVVDVVAAVRTALRAAMQGLLELEKPEGKGE